MRIALLPLVLTAALALPGAEKEVRSFSESYDAGDLRAVALDVPLGEVVIEGYSGDRIEIDVVLECNDGWGSSSCPDRAQDVELVARERGDRIAIELTGYSKWRTRGLEIEITMRLPSTLSLALDMGIGEVEIRGLENDVTVDMGIGEVNLAMRVEDVGAVSLDTGIGEASLRTPEGRKESSGLFTKELKWTNDGEARIKIDLGIGEVDVRLS